MPEIDDYDLFDLDFEEFLRRGIIETYGDHPGNGLEEVMKQFEVME